MGDLADHTVATPPSREVRTADIILAIHRPYNTRVKGGPTLVAVEHVEYPELGNKQSLIVFSKAGTVLYSSMIENFFSAATGLWETRWDGRENRDAKVAKDPSHGACHIKELF